MLKGFRKAEGQKGFTLIELMIVIAIIGILAAIAIPQFMTYRQKGYDAAAMSDIKQAYTAAQAYFTDWPNASVDATRLTGAGYTRTSLVTLTIGNGTQTGLSFTTHHANGAKTYTISKTGEIGF